MESGALYEGCEGRQGRVEPRIASLELRVALAAVLAIVAVALPSTRAYSSHGDARVELLAPRGSLEEPPRAVSWAGELDADRVRILVAGPTGEGVVDKWVGGGVSRSCFDADERRRIAGCASGSTQIFAVAADGELLGASAPARFTLSVPPAGR